MKLTIDFPEIDYKFMRDTYKETGITFVPEAIKNECVKSVYNSTPYERKTGKWILTHPLQVDDGGAYMCSCCGTGSWEVDPITWKACPWCTALMEGVDDE